MRQTTKKIFTFLLALCLILGLLPAYAHAVSAAEEEDLVTQSMTLGSDLTLHLWGKLPAAYEEYAGNITATLTYSDKVETKNLSELEKNESGYYHLPVEMAVAEMSENINLVMKFGSVEILNRNYSVRDYLTALLEGNYSQQTKELCLELLNFGARAQEYFGYDLGNLADAGLDITAANAVPGESPAVNVSGAVEGVSAHSISVRFLSNTAVRFYFNVAGDVNSYTFTIGGTQYTPVEKDGMYYIETPGINPQHMSDLITVNVTDGADVLSLQYAPIWFFVRVHNKSQEAVARNLMEAAYSYYKEAEVYTVGPPVEIETTEPETTEPETTEPETTEPETTEPETTEPETTEPETTEPETTEPEETEPSTYLSMDLLLTTLSNSTDPVEIRLYNYTYEGSVGDGYTDLTSVTAGTTTTIKVNVADYLVNGELPGFGVAIMGGPEWNTQISDGVYDRHSVVISNVRLEGVENRSISLNGASIAAGTTDTGFTWANSGGVASIVDGKLVISGGYRYDAYEITFGEETQPETTEPETTEPEEIEPETTEPEETEPSTYLSMDLLFTTLGGSTDPVELRFYPYNYEGSVHSNFTDKITVTAGTAANIKLDLNKYLVDGELPGIGFAIFGGPAWDAKLPDGSTPDRHTVTISNVRLEGAQTKAFDLSKSVWTKAAEAGYTDANSSGAATMGSSIVITNGFQYDGHKISLVEDTNTYLSMDLLLTTLSNSTDPVEIRLYNYTYEGSVGDGYTDLTSVTAGTTTTIKVNVADYLVNGELPGFGVAIMGGPEWNTQISDGVYDRHSVVISNVRLEGVENRSISLNGASIAAGTTDTGFTWANSGGVAAIANGELVISGGYRYDAYEITFGEETQPETTEPETTEPETTEPEETEPETTEPEETEPSSFLSMDLLFTTLGGSTDPVEIGFYPNNFEGDINNWTDKIAVTAGTTSTIKLDLEKYLVNGELPGIGFVIFGGPAWDAKLPDGYTPDRHTVTISNVHLGGEQSKAFDLSKSVWTKAAEAGYTNANGSGEAAIDSTIVITNGFQYDGHKITLVEDTNTYICMDLLLNTVSGSWANDVEIRFCNNSQTESVHTAYADKISVTVGNKVSVKLNAEKYLVDGGLPGFGIAIFGGPEWNTQISDGVYDRHSVVISNVRLEGAENRSIDLNNATVSVGLPGSNSGGASSIVDGEVVITGGFCYDGHKIAF